jgi:cytochrome c553
MRTRHAACLLIAAAVLGLAATTASAGDAERGRKLAYACMGCHGSENYKNAYPKYSVPKLGGQNTLYIIAALDQYASADRWHPTMQGYAGTLSAEDRADLAAWFTSLAKPSSGARPAGTAPEKAAACVACHGQGGEGTLDEYPNIGGQHADYLAQALNDYRLGKRKNAVMAPFAQQLSREDIAALAAYFASQPGLTTPHHD